MENNNGKSQKCSKLQKNYEKLVQKLKYVEHIAEELHLTGPLTKDNLQGIRLQTKTNDKKRELIDQVIRTDASDKFTSCLYVTYQSELLELMTDTETTHSVAGELTTLKYRVYCEDEVGDPKGIQVPRHIQQRLDEQREALQGMKDVESLLVLMNDEKCLTAEVTTQIKEQLDNTEKVKLLVDHVKESKLYSYFVLTQFLDISQQKELMSKISEKDTKKALECMDDLLINVYYNLLGAIALEHSNLEKRLGIEGRDFVTLTINSSSKAVDRRGAMEAQDDQSPGSGIELTGLFCGTVNNKPTQKVLLIGAPGAGKTTAVLELARKATATKIPSLPRPPFVILLRTIDWKNETSLKNLLLRCGPNLLAKEQDKIWCALQKSEITLFLDGADEVPGGFFIIKPAPVPGGDSKAFPRDILNSIISGKLLPGARVLVSSRPFNLALCWDHFDRKVDVCGFDEDSLDHFLENELPRQHLKEVQSFLESHTYIRSLLLIPLHAASFVLRAKATKDTKNLLLESSTEVSLSLIDSLVKTMLHKVHGDDIPEQYLEEQCNNLRKLCKLVAKLLCSEGVIKTEMTWQDLKLGEISAQECEATGVFKEQVRVQDGVKMSFFMVPHQSILESLAAVGLEEEQIVKLVEDNDGRHDLVLTYVVGILGSAQSGGMLNCVLSKKGDEKNFKKLTQVVVRAVLVSKRRLLHGGEEFCQRIVVESQQWDLIADLMRVMRSRWLTLDSSEALMSADQLIQQDPHRVRVQVGGISNMKYCPQATALVHDDKVTAVDIADNSKHLQNIKSISFYRTGITQETLAGVARQLRQLKNLEAMIMGGNKVGLSSSSVKSVLSCLSLIPSLEYLSLSDCHLTSDDVVTVTSSCPLLRHLNISRNPGIRGADVKSRQLIELNVERCDLPGDAVVTMAASHGETLKYLDAMYNYVLSSTHINDLLFHCRLVELYISGGGELVQALSNRRAACHLNHLLLSYCDLSSSSSSRYQVNSSMLCDVLRHHRSIATLTLHECGPFTTDFMYLLSLSMASITSLFISPAPYHSHPPRPSDVASLIRTSPSLTQLWLDDIQDEWHVSDYIDVIEAINASPALRFVGLDIQALTVKEVCIVVSKLKQQDKLKQPLTRLWLGVGYINSEHEYEKMREEYAMVIMEEEPGVIQLLSVNALYRTYVYESRSRYQHLPPFLQDDFRHLI